MLKTRFVRHIVAALTLAVLFGVLSAVPPTTAQDPGGGLPTLDEIRARIQSNPDLMNNVQVVEGYDEVVEAVVVLQAPSIVEAGGALGPQGVSSVEASQANAIALAQGLGMEIIGRTTATINSIGVRGNVMSLRQLALQPGVEAVYRAPELELHNAGAVPAVGAPGFWEATGNYGQGMVVAIIDSGINYGHDNFGNCTYTPNGDPNQTLGQFSGENCKLIGGYDFWDNDPEPQVCNPDAAALGLDPSQDDDAHGTHVAGSAIGYGTMDGEPYMGPYDASTPIDEMTIGPGIAPGAQGLIYRVGDCTTSVSGFSVLNSIDQAVLDGADVMNMSLGGPFGSPFYDEAINNAVAAGVVVVASAGNSGDTTFVTGTPGGSPAAISVSALQDASVSEASLSVNSPFTDTTTNIGLEAFDPPGPTLESVAPLTGDLAVPEAGNELGCNPITADLTGFIALIQRGACAFTTKVENSQNAGAIAVVIYSDGRPVGGMSGTPTIPITIPAVLIPTDFGENIAASIGEGNTVNITLDVISGTGTEAVFTSRGPRRAMSEAGVLLKPDLGAPGVDIISSHAEDSTFPIDNPDNDPIDFGGPPPGGFDPEVSDSKSGTSMSAPMVAGGAALLAQTYPNWTPQQIKAFMMNTASDIFDNTLAGAPRHGPSRVGAGQMQFESMLFNQTAEVIAFDTEQPASVGVSFGMITTDVPTTDTRSVTVQNLSSRIMGYAITVDTIVDTPGVTVSVNPTFVQIQPNSTATFNVTISIDPGQIGGAPVTDPTSTRNDTVRPAEENGLILLRPVDDVAGGTLRVPFVGMARPAGNIAATDTFNVLDPAGSGSTGVQFANGAGIDTGDDFPNDIVSLTSGFELLGEDPAEPGTPDWLDLRYFGASTNAPYFGDAAGLIYFAFATEGTRSIPYDAELYVDLNFCSPLDAGAAFGLPGTPVVPFSALNNQSLVQSGKWSWAFIDYFNLYGLGSGAVLSFTNPAFDYWVNWYSPDVIDTGHADSELLVLPVDIFFMRGLADLVAPFFPSCSDGIIEVSAASYDRFGLTLQDEIGTFATDPIPYNYLNPVYDFAGLSDETGALAPLFDLPVWESVNSEDALSFNYDFTGLVTPPDLMLFHFHNAPGNRVQILSPAQATEYDLSAVKEVDNEVPTAGDTVTFTLRVQNFGAGPIDQVISRDFLPAGLTFNGTETCSDVGGTFTAGTPGGEPFVCDFGATTFSPGAEAAWQLGATVDEGISAVNLRNILENESTNDALTDTNLTTNRSEIDICVDGDPAECNEAPIFFIGDTGGAALTVVGQYDADAVGIVGDGLTWNVVATNTTNAVLNNVVITMNTDGSNDMLSVSTSSGSASLASALPDISQLGMMKLDPTVAAGGDSGVSAALSGTVVISSIAPGQSVQISVDAVVISTPADGVYNMTATMTADGGYSVSATGALPGVGGLPDTGYPPQD
jgi:uncharacterized repeat protein (TIGR01451 family)